MSLFWEDDRFEWDLEKAALNLTKHKVTFVEASTVFDDPLSLTIPDPLHSDIEDRFLIIGRSEQGRLLVVSHIERGNRIRLISAREAERHEKRDYEQGNYGSR